MTYITALNNVITTFGKTVTVAELIKAGDLSDKLSVIGGMLASYYVGAMKGSTAVALEKVLAENNSFDDISFSLDDASESESDRKRANDWNKTWNRAKTTSSPLVLDLDSDGVETIHQDKGVYFDHAGDGFAELTGWAGADDGLLVRDLNGDGRISSGAELFGNHTRLQNGSLAANGFAALADLDSNRDGVIDKNDSAWGSLRVWRDQDSDGFTDEGELLALEQVGVNRIDLKFQNKTVTDGQGNEHRQTGSYTLADGSTRAVNDVWFGVTNWDTQDQRAAAEVSEEKIAQIAKLPNLQGFGNLGNLQQAMIRDASGKLQALVA